MKTVQQGFRGAEAHGGAGAAGATAWLHAGVPIEVIKRWGRWLSDSFQRYVWDANEDAKGLSKKEIAPLMHISVKIVDKHVTQLMTKLEIHDRVGLSRYAIREGLIEP